MGQPQEIEFAWLLIAGISITFMLAVSVILFVVFYQKKLFIQQIKLKELKNIHQKNLLIVGIQVQEKERERIAHDLHDEVGATLSASKLYLSYLSDNPQVSGIAHKIETLINTASQNLRDISHNITPQNLEKFGLVSALSEISNRINSANKVKVNFCYNAEKRLDIDKELGLYRITQELLNNTLKHSEATEIDIYLEFGVRSVMFNYKDNGKGVDLKNISLDKKNGLGLQNIIGRCELWDTQIEYESELGKGFKASLRIDNK